MTALQVPLFRDGRTTVVNVDREVCDVYVGRPRGRQRVEDCRPGEPGYFGNPFNVREFPDALERFRVYFLGRVATDPAFRRAVLALRGKRLGCFCVVRGDEPCHGKVMADWLEQAANAA